MPPIVSGQCFASLQDFKNALRNWAIEKNFTPHIRDSDANRVRAGCRSNPGCPFRIRANFKNGVAKVSTCNDVHTCTSGQHLSQNIKRAEISKVEYLLKIVPQLLDVTPETPTQSIIDAVQEKYGQEIALRQAQKVKSALCPKAREACRICGAATHRNPSSRKLEPCPQDPRTVADQAITENHSMADAGDSEMQMEFNDGGNMQFQGGSELQQNGHAHMAPNDQSSAQNNNQINPSIETNLLEDRLLSARLLLNAQPQPVTGFVRAALPRSTNLNDPNAQIPKTPQDAMMEVARLMQNAARMMQEAARLNNEAARLITSVANAGKTL